MSRERPDAAEPRPASDRIDLHSHSHFSDGEDAPRDVAGQAARAGIAALALTDHDCLDGLPEFLEHARGFEPVCGVEVSARFRGNDIHVVGLFISPEDEGLRARLATLAEHRSNRVGAMVERLRNAGVTITEDDVWAHCRSGTVGRPHVAHALVTLGVVRTVDEAFRRYLRPKRPGFVDKPGPSPMEAIEWIHEAAGVAVLAHPGLMRDATWVSTFAEAGLDGIEVWHPRHSPALQDRWMAVAVEHGLVPSGGSDYHGASIGDAVIGQEPVPRDSLDRLRARLRLRG